MQIERQTLFSHLIWSHSLSLCNTRYSKTLVYKSMKLWLCFHCNMQWLIVYTVGLFVPTELQSTLQWGHELLAISYIVIRRVQISRGQLVNKFYCEEFFFSFRYKSNYNSMACKLKNKYRRSFTYSDLPGAPIVKIRFNLVLIVPWHCLLSY